jgi:hypothetical protein
MDRRALLTPALAFPALWLLALGLAQIPVVSLQRPWSGRMWAVALLVPAVFASAGVLGQELARGGGSLAGSWLAAARGRLPLRPILVACVVVGYAELAHQFATSGQVPLFAADIDAARFAQPGGITIVLTDLLTVAAVLAIVAPASLLARKAWPELAITLAALFGFALQGGRGSVVLPIVAGTFGRVLYRGLPRFEWLVASAALVTAVGCAIFFVRTAQHSGNTFETEFYSRDLPAVPWVLRPLVPVHLAFAMNFEVLARIVDYFPKHQPFGHWRYDVGLFDRYLPALDANTVSGTQVSPFVTKTLAGSFWADGGYLGVAVGVTLVALLSSAAYALARVTEQLRYAAVAGYLLYLTLFGLYDNLFTAFPDWLVVTPLLFLIATVAGPRRGETAAA